MTPASQIVCSCSTDLGAWASLMWHVGFCSLSYHEAGAELQEDYNEAFSAQPVQSTTNIKLFLDVRRLAAQEPGCEGLAGGL